MSWANRYSYQPVAIQTITLQNLKVECDECEIEKKKKKKEEEECEEEPKCECTECACARGKTHGKAVSHSHGGEGHHGHGGGFLGKMKGAFHKYHAFKKKFGLMSLN